MDEKNATVKAKDVLNDEVSDSTTQRDTAVRTWNLFLGFLHQKGLGGESGKVDMKKPEVSGYLKNLAPEMLGSMKKKVE